MGYYEILLLVPVLDYHSTYQEISFCHSDKFGTGLSVLLGFSYTEIPPMHLKKKG